MGRQVKKKRKRKATPMQDLFREELKDLSPVTARLGELMLQKHKQDLWPKNTLKVRALKKKMVITRTEKNPKKRKKQPNPKKFKLDREDMELARKMGQDYISSPGGI